MGLEELIEHPAVKRLTQYVRVDTRCNEPGPDGKVVTSPGQLEFVAARRSDLIDMGFEPEQMITLNDGSLFAILPATPGYEDAPCIPVVFHPDTIPDLPGKARPEIIFVENADRPIQIKPGVQLSPRQIEDKGLVGKHIMVSRAKGVLGADDAAGGAATMTALEQLLEWSLPHGEIHVLVGCNEEVGEMPMHEVPEEHRNRWDFMVLPDGEELGPLGIGCFYGIKVSLRFRGTNAHPGVGGDQIHSAIGAAGALVVKLEKQPDRPQLATGDQPFYMVDKVSGNTDRADMTILIRTFDLDEGKQMRIQLYRWALQIARKHGVRRMRPKWRIQYRNTEEITPKNDPLLLLLWKVQEQLGIETRFGRDRGGTDQAIGLLHDIKLPPGCTIGLGARLIHAANEVCVLEELVEGTRVIYDFLKTVADMRREDDAAEWALPSAA